MDLQTTITPLHQPGSVDDPLTEIAADVNWPSVRHAACPRYQAFGKLSRRRRASPAKPRHAPPAGGYSGPSRRRPLSARVEASQGD